MVFKNFRLNVIFRLLLLTATIFGLIYLLMTKDYYVTPILFGILVVVQFFGLIHYVEKTNRDLTNFLESIRFSDFSRSFQIEGLGKSFDNLKNAFNDVISDFQKIRTQKEEHYFYLQNIIQHVNVSIISYQPNGKIEMVNNAAKKMFQIRSLKNVKQLEPFSRELVDILLSLKPGDNKLVKVHEEEDILQLAVYSTEFKLEDRRIILVSIKNIQSELEEQEMEAWQKLIRVLTHEIMNSIAPIASLTSTVELMLKEVSDAVETSQPKDFDMETIEDINNALATIKKRSNGLIHFVETYRNLTKIPKPNFTIFKVEELLSNIKQLHENDLKTKNIECQITIEPQELQMTADEQLIEQVIVNLVKNSIQALCETTSPKIEMTAFTNKRGRVTIQVSDNGQGIIKEVLDKIFIPFFTTKQSGSGIGLSLSKQILRLHGGTISCQSEPDVKTIFTLTF